jgi:PEP-CTERM motif
LLIKIDNQTSIGESFNQDPRNPRKKCSFPESAGRKFAMKMNWLLSACTAFAFCSATFGASATTVRLPDAQWTGILEAFVPGAGPLITQVTGPGATTASYSGTGYNVSATAVGSASPTPRLTTEAGVAASPTPDNVSALSELELTYYVEIVGPSGEVPLGVKTIGMTSSALGSVDGATAELDLSFGPSFTAVSFAGLPTPSLPTSFNINDTYQIAANTVFSVTVSSNAFAQTCPTCAQPDSGMASAFVDPYFYVSPEFANSSEYFIVTSPGIGNILPIPEPSAWAMMLLGFAGLGFAAYRRSRAKNSDFPF